MEIHELSAIDIRDKFLKGEFTAVQIITHFLNRIKTYDSKLGAFLCVFEEDALEKAKKLDEKKQNGEKLGKNGCHSCSDKG